MISTEIEGQNLKKRLNGRAQVFGAWTSLGHASIAEIFCKCGVDFVGIDIEHSTISLEQAQHIIMACHGAGVFCLPRIASHNMEMVKRLLDAGADGIIVPMVSTPSEVEEIVKWCKYPPVGERSYGIARAQGYGFDFEPYVEEWNTKSILIIQIESARGIENIEELINHGEVDGAMIGPYDLSGSMGIPGQIDHPKIAEAESIVINACKKRGKACGTQMIDPDRAGVKGAFEKGYTFVVLASDIFALWSWSRKMKRIMDSGAGS